MLFVKICLSVLLFHKGDITALYINQLAKCCFLFDYRGEPMMANCTIQFQTAFINHVVIKYLFLRAIDNNNKTQLNGLALNRQYTAGKYSLGSDKVKNL